MKQSLISTYTTHITAVSACLRTVTKVEENYDILAGSCRCGCLNPSCKRLAVLRRLRSNRALRSRSAHRASYTVRLPTTSLFHWTPYFESKNHVVLYHGWSHVLSADFTSSTVYYDMSRRIVLPMVLKLLMILGEDFLKRTKIDPPLIFGKTMSTKKK